ncbi:MAG: hypothetical protein AAGI38_22305, partial [Bacteroidota bacterium]
VFFKQMTHHLPGLSREFMGKMANVLLIRDPYELLLSYTKVVEAPVMADIGMADQYELGQELKVLGCLTAVIDARELLKNPEYVLRLLCEQLGITFDSAMLSWPAGPKPYDGSWAPYWYSGVHQSTGFKPYQKREGTLNPIAQKLYEEARPFYEALKTEALKAQPIT